MSNIVIYLLFILGIFLIVKGGDIFVDASTWIAKITGIPSFIIGATVVSFATTLPELLVSLMAASKGSVDMAIGNAVGSVTANVGLIFAISLIFTPTIIKRRAFAPKAFMMIFAAILLWVLCLSGHMTIFGAAIMLCIFGVFVYENIVSAKKSEEKDDGEKPSKTPKDITINIIKFVLGAAGIVIGADLLVDNGSEIARMFGVSEAIIGVTIIAIGTSLPELVTAITAIAKKQSSLSVGNIVGANIIDLTVILPLCSFISGGSLPVQKQSFALDLPVCALVCGIAVIPSIISGKLKRAQGILLILVYVAYIVVLCTVFR